MRCAAWWNVTTHFTRNGPPTAPADAGTSGRLRHASESAIRRGKPMTASPNKLIGSVTGPPPSDERLPFFSRLSNEVARLTGKPVTFAICCLTIVVWAATGPIFHYSDTWQLIINTGTTIVTFLMVFLIQN